jgi:ABC-type phosphate transport system substrate-binding protein
MTYRAVGSGTGQTEFIGDVSDFGSADIPLTAAQYAGFASVLSCKCRFSSAR